MTRLAQPVHYRPTLRRRAGSAAGEVLAAKFARFLGLPLPRNLNQVDITNAVCDVLNPLGTGMREHLHATETQP